MILSLYLPKIIRTKIHRTSKGSYKILLKWWFWNNTNAKIRVNIDTKKSPDKGIQNSYIYCKFTEIFVQLADPDHKDLVDQNIPENNEPIAHEFQDLDGNVYPYFVLFNTAKIVVKYFEQPDQQNFEDLDHDSEGGWDFASHCNGWELVDSGE